MQVIILDEAAVARYARDDYIAEVLETWAEPIDHKMQSHIWLTESLPKRAVFDLLYGDVISSSGKSILDAGGGFTSLTRLFAQNHDYYLVDSRPCGSLCYNDVSYRYPVSLSWDMCDWHDFKPIRGGYDLIIANDLFPNVDQRLDLFLEKFLPLCSEMRLSLTYHNTPKWYTAKRVDGDEIITMLAWDGWHLRAVLDKYFDRIAFRGLESPGMLLEDRPSMFPNGRQVAIVKMRGGG